MASRPRRTFLSATLALLVLGACACASPTLPLPPPSTPDIAPAANGQWTLSSKRGVEGHAIVVIFNRNPDLPAADRVDGTQADADGNWEETITAGPGDVVDVTQEFGSTRSAPTTFRIPKPSP
jgi:hypothetical protein